MTTPTLVDAALEDYVASRAHHQMHGWEGAPPHADGCHLCRNWRTRNEDVVAIYFTAGWNAAIDREAERQEIIEGLVEAARTASSHIMGLAPGSPEYLLAALARYDAMKGTTVGEGLQRAAAAARATSHRQCETCGAWLLVEDNGRVHPRKWARHIQTKRHNNAAHIALIKSMKTKEAL